MSQVGIVRDNAIIPITAGQDLTGYEGRPVILFDGEAMIADSAADYQPFGVLLKGGKAGETVSVAVAAGGFAGTVRILVMENVSAGNYLQVKTTGSAPYGAFGKTTVFERYVLAQALEDGLEGEKIEAVLFKPEYFTE